MLRGNIELRRCNWKPVLFTAILLASKFWEDINFWNIDYEEALSYYSLAQINRLEAQFVSLCDYQLFVSAEHYTKYFIAIKELKSAITAQERQQ